MHRARSRPCSPACRPRSRCHRQLYRGLDHPSSSLSRWRALKCPRWQLPEWIRSASRIPDQNIGGVTTKEVEGLGHRMRSRALIFGCFPPFPDGTNLVYICTILVQQRRMAVFRRSLLIRGPQFDTIMVRKAAREDKPVDSGNGPRHRPQALRRFHQHRCPNGSWYEKHSHPPLAVIVERRLR